MIDIIVNQLNFSNTKFFCLNCQIPGFSRFPGFLATLYLVPSGVKTLTQVFCHNFNFCFFLNSQTPLPFN